MPSLTRLRPALAAAAAAATLLATACELDVANPNAATEDRVTTTAAGVRALGVGLQGRWANAYENAVWIPGLLAGELGATNASLGTHREFQRFPDASANSPRIEEVNPDLLNFWSRHYQVVRSSDDILRNLGAVTLAPGTASGLSALAKTMKAYAFGTLIEAWDAIPIEVSSDQPAFVDRATARTTTLSLLASARQDLATTAPSAEFTSQILLPGIDLPNTIRAWQARYALNAGRHAEALAFANEVPATATSEYRFTTADQSTLWSVFNGLRYFAAQSSLRTNAEAGDTRAARLFDPAPQAAFGGATLNRVLIFATQTEPVPLFTQDELSLIRAEAHARLNQLAEARTQVNVVRQRAGLAPRAEAALATQQAILDEVLRQRRYSLFATGTALADLRRFGRLSEARAASLPYPLNERTGNPNTPANP